MNLDLSKKLGIIVVVLLVASSILFVTTAFAEKQSCIPYCPAYRGGGGCAGFDCEPMSCVIDLQNGIAHCNYWCTPIDPPCPGCCLA